jgi:hypothetical protein
MGDKLLKTLQEVQTKLQSGKDIGIKKLERLSAKTRRSFDSAIESIANSKNFIQEIDLNRESLKRWRISVYKTIFPLNFKYLISVPFIYGMLIPALFFHLCLEIYHQVCFRIYDIPLVKPSDFFIYDRNLLPYLNWLEKINCFYCGYVNNLMRYGTEIGGRTERFWCPIKYSRRIEQAHSQYPKFVGYLDAGDFRGKWKKLRDFSDIKLTDKKSSKVKNNQLK